MKLNMEQEILVKHVESSKIEWQPLIEDDVNTKGIFVKILRYDEAAKRAPVILLKFEPGAKYPAHNHPEGKKFLCLKVKLNLGTCIC